MVLLAACQTPAPNPPPPANGAPVQPLPPKVEPARLQKAEDVPVPVILSPAEVQATVVAARNHLDAGEEDAAEADLKRVLQSDSNKNDGSYKLAQSLWRQIKEDPAATLGAGSRDSFAYKVQAGDSLSSIAGRFLCDVHLFYALARFNKIEVPKSLAAGREIRLPRVIPPCRAGDPGPPKVKDDTAAATAAATRQKAAEDAAAAAARQKADEAAVLAARQKAEAAAAARAAKQRNDDIVRYTKLATVAYARQDLAGAISWWEKVLAIDPENRNAQLQRQKAITLKDKLKDVK